MLTILCENEAIINGEKRRCGRWLAQLTQLQIDIMKVDPEAKFYLRCPACKPDVRFKEISCVNGKMIFSICKCPVDSEILKYDTLEIAEEVA